ncbi:MAG: hypothetical protein ACLFVW_09945 [Phycisphaerae bacterium]
MTGLNTPDNQDMPNPAAVEQRLAAKLDAAADEISRAECFDSEQRAEVYAILAALREETNIHRDQAAQLAGKYVKDDDGA